MSAKDTAAQTAANILLSSIELFAQQGYSKTNIRQIAAHAGVSLGLVNHYYGSKRNLGYKALETLIRYVMSVCDRVQPLTADPDAQTLLLTDFLATRVVNAYLFQGIFRQFYIDTLSEDLFFNYLEDHSTLVISKLQEAYDFTIDDDMAELYSRYIPFSIEKTLVLKKLEGLFPSISEEDIPFQISASTYSNFLPKEVIREADMRSRELCPRILEHLDAIPSRETILQLLDNAEKERP